jgi:hypothetical protein
MKYNTLFFHCSLVVLTLVLFVPAQAQVNLKVGGGVGIMSAVSDLNGTTQDYYSGSSYGQNSGLNIHAKGKVGLAGFNITGSIDYSSLGHSGNSEPGQGSVELTQKIVSLKVGPEFQFSIPALPITPYVGANIGTNSFTGEVKFQGVSKVPSATYTVQSATRLGAGVTVGAEVGIGPLMTLDFTTAYNFMNISGSEWTDVNPAVDQRIDSYLALNDAKDPLYAAGNDKHFIANDRSIHSMVFTVSILFGL